MKIYVKAHILSRLHAIPSYYFPYQTFIAPLIPRVYFNINNFQNLLEEYYYSKNSSIRYSDLRNSNFNYFGMELYDLLQEHVISTSRSTNNLRRKSFHAIWEHKKGMIERIQYIHEQGYLKESEYLIEEYNDLEKKTLILRNLMLKYNLTKKQEILKKMIPIIQFIQEKEKITIEILIESIQRHRTN